VGRGRNHDLAALHDPLRDTSGNGEGGEEEEIEQEPEAGSSGPPEEEIEEVKSQK